MLHRFVGFLINYKPKEHAALFYLLTLIKLKISDEAGSVQTLFDCNLSQLKPSGTFLHMMWESPLFNIFGSWFGK